MRASRVVIVSRQTRASASCGHEQAGSLSAAASPVFTEGTLCEGWVLRLPDARGKLHLLTDSEIFGWERPQPRLRPHSVAAPPEAEYADLRAGDYVVHVDYGIGRFVGLVRRTLDGAEREFLCVEYDGGDQLFVPVYQADRLSRYIGPGGEAAATDPAGRQRMGATSSSACAKRCWRWPRNCWNCTPGGRLPQGHAFQADSPWQQELEASFPYVETEDQLKAIAAVKRDMERAARWTACCAATWATARPRWRCARPSRRSWTANRWRCWCRPPCWRSSITRPSGSGWRLSR